MRKYIKLVFVLSMLCFIMCSNHTNALAENSKVNQYERDYLSKLFDSDNGIAGTAVNCVCPDAEGFLWFGAYTGLYRYDGNEFKKYLMDGRALPVNDIVEDEEENLWIGTNGDGLYRFDGAEFTEYQLNEDACGASVVKRLYLDSAGMLWVGTKAGLFSINTRENETDAREYRGYSDTFICDIGETAAGEMVIIQKSGEVSLLKGESARTISLPLSEEDGAARCCKTLKDGSFYLGTTGNVILKITENGEVTEKIQSTELSCFNSISELSGNEFWVCSDTGVGILSDHEILPVKTSIADSMENVCQDYQGNYWFVSSRQGILQLYKNYFSDMGSYWGLKETVNSIQVYQGKTYVGCDDGLYCFYGNKMVQDALTVSCQKKRVRQIYLDQENHLWVSTYQDGIWKLDADRTVSRYHAENSGLETNQIRCIWQRKNKEILIGTEDGLYVQKTDGTIQKFTEDAVLGTTRILNVKEDSRGIVYAATDGYGVYEVKDGAVTNIFNKKQGMLSNVAMKLVPSKRMEGTWVVTGEGICFIDWNGNVKEAAGIPVANSLDLLIEDDQVVILAGNGVFRAKEKDLLKETVAYTCLGKEDGLPIDFTANAGNSIKDGILYMCGTTGAARMDLNEEPEEKPIRLYVNEFTEDGESVEGSRSENKMIISSGAHRIDLDIRLISFVHQNLYAVYCLDGTAKEETRAADLKSGVSYTNLRGGAYTCTYKVYSKEAGKCVSQLPVSFIKEYKFQEKPVVRVLLAFLFAGALSFVYILLVTLREKGVKRRCYLEFLQEKEAEISELAYKDLVTGVYNRNYFEHEKDEIDLSQMYALLSVSINHAEYLKRKYGVFFMENILRKGVKILQDCTEEKIKICRVSESVFYFWFMKPIQVETYIRDIKTAFQEEGEKENIPYSFSVGAIYNNAVGKECIDDLIGRCGKMRILDEKHAEAKFVEGKVKLL